MAQTPCIRYITDIWERKIPRRTTQDAELDLNKEEAPIVLDNEAEPEKAEIEVLDETEEEVEIV